MAIENSFEALPLTPERKAKKKSKSLMNIKAIRRALDLSVVLARLGFKRKTEGSYLGILWYLLNPLLMFLLLLRVFSDRLGGKIPLYPAYLLLGIIVFNFFRKATTESTRAIYEHRWVIRSVNFPRETLVCSVVLKAAFSHLFEIALFVAVLLLYKISLAGVLFYPLILFFFCTFVFGACLILSAVSVYFIDLQNIWAFVSRLIWLATPVFYAIGGQTKLLFVNLFNPMYYFLTISRDVMIYGKVPELWMLAGAAVHSLVFLAAGLLIFGKLKHRFAEMM